MLDLQGFEAYLMREERSDNTIACYLRDTAAFLQWYEGEGKAIHELTLITYKRYLNAKENSVITANRKLASVNAFYRYLYDARILARSLCRQAHQEPGQAGVQGIACCGAARPAGANSRSW